MSNSISKIKKYYLIFSINTRNIFGLKRLTCWNFLEFVHIFGVQINYRISNFRFDFPNFQQFDLYLIYILKTKIIYYYTFKN